MYEIMIFLAGIVLGLFHAWDKRRAEREAYQTGRKQAQDDTNPSPGQESVRRPEPVKHPVSAPGYAPAAPVGSTLAAGHRLSADHQPDAEGPPPAEGPPLVGAPPPAHTKEAARSRRVNEITRAAAQYGRAAGRVQ